MYKCCWLIKWMEREMERGAVTLIQGWQCRHCQWAFLITWGTALSPCRFQKSQAPSCILSSLFIKTYLRFKSASGFQGKPLRRPTLSPSFMTHKFRNHCSKPLYNNIWQVLFFFFFLFLLKRPVTFLNCQFMVQAKRLNQKHLKRCTFRFHFDNTLGKRFLPGYCQCQIHHSDMTGRKCRKLWN